LNFKDKKYNDRNIIIIKTKFCFKMKNYLMKSLSELLFELNDINVIFMKMQGHL